MSNIRELQELMPFIPFNSSHSLISLAESNSPVIDDWVNENIEIGLRGEQYVRKYFEEKHNAIVTKLPDSFGYDFRVEFDDNKFAVEVKAAQNYKHFFISHNEMKTAKEMRESYYIYFISEFDGSTGRLFKIQDPYQKLNFERFLGRFGKNSIADFLIASIKINLKDLSACGFEEVSVE